jgi:predicted RND superfamily exporter protein
MREENMEDAKMPSKVDRLCRFMTRHRATVLIIVLIITAIFGYATFKIKGEVLLHEMFPYDHPYLKLNARFGEVFGTGGSGVVIAVKAKKGDIFNQKTLTKIKNITEEVEMWDEVYRVLTVSMASNSTKVSKALAKGEIQIEALMFPNIPQNEQEMAELKKNVFSNPSYAGTLVSEDGTAALVLTEMRENITYQTMFTKLRALTAKYEDNDTSVHIVGFPMLMGWIYSLKSQTLMVSLISFALMIVILYVMFRNLVGMLAPMASTVVLTIIGLGFIGFTGINFSPLLYVLAFLMIARIVSNSVQLTYRYLEELPACNNDSTRACYETMRVMLFPNWTGVSTDMAGFAALYLAKITLMQNLAIIMTFWMFSIGLTGIMVPIVCSLIPMRKASERYAKETCQLDWQAKGLASITRFSLSPRGKYVVGALILAVFVLCSWQMGRLKIGDATPGSPLLWQNHPYNRDQVIVNNTFNASSENLVLFYEGTPESVYDPEVLHTFEKFTLYMAQKLPDIYKTSSSIMDTAKMVSLTQHDGDQTWYQMPTDHEQLQGLLGYIRNTIGTASLRRYIDGTLERCQVTLYFADHTSDNLLRIRDAAYEFFKTTPMKTANGEFKLAGGRLGMEIGVNQEMIHAHTLMDSAVLAAIFILITFGFRSLVGGLMVSLPLIFANSSAFAYMALRNIGVTINSLPVAAAGLGIGDNFCIYLYSRCMEELPLRNGDWKEAIIQSICTSGKAVLYTGITIVLPILTWYLFSDFRFQAEVGLFLSIIVAVNVLLVFTLHPLMVYLIKPKFISGEPAVDKAAAKASIAVPTE